MLSKKTLFSLLLASTAIGYCVATQPYERDNAHIKSVKVNELYFPPNFLFGFAIAEQQNSGKIICPKAIGLAGSVQPGRMARLILKEANARANLQIIGTVIKKTYS